MSKLDEILEKSIGIAVLFTDETQLEQIGDIKAEAKAEILRHYIPREEVEQIVLKHSSERYIASDSILTASTDKIMLELAVAKQLLERKEDE